jgi:myosin heavy subunit
MAPDEFKDIRKKMKLVQYTSLNFWRHILPVGALIASALIGYFSWNYVNDAKLDLESARDKTHSTQIEHLKQKADQVAELGDKYKSATAEKQGLNEKVSEISREYTRFKQDAQKKQEAEAEEKRALSQKNTNLSDTVEGLKSEFKTKENELRAELKSKENKITVLESEYDTLEAKMQEKEHNAAETEKRIKMQAAMNKGYQKIIDEQQTKIDLLEKDKKTLKDEVDELDRKAKEKEVYKDGEIQGEVRDGQIRIIFPTVGETIDPAENKKYKLDFGDLFEQAFAIYVPDGKRSGFYQLLEKQKNTQWMARNVPRSKIIILYNRIKSNSGAK